MDYALKEVFQLHITQALSASLSDYIINTLSNTLFIDFHLRESEIGLPTDQYAKKCAVKIKRHLGTLIMLEDSFSTVLNLFAVAISDDQETYQEDITVKKRVAQCAVQTLKNQLTQPESNTLEDSLLSMGQHNFDTVVDFIGENPEAVSKLVAESQGARSNCAKNLISAAKEENKKSSMLGRISQGFGLVSASVASILAVGIATVSFGVLAPVAILPVAFASLRYGAEIGSKIGKYVYNTDVTSTKNTANHSLISEAQGIKISTNKATDMCINVRKDAAKALEQIEPYVVQGDKTKNKKTKQYELSKSQASQKNSSKNPRAVSR